MNHDLTFHDLMDFSNDSRITISWRLEPFFHCRENCVKKITVFFVNSSCRFTVNNVEISGQFPIVINQ